MARSCYASPCRPAREAAAAREGSPSLRRMLATWRLTVCSLRTRRCAMSWFVRPSATRLRTSNSRLLSSPSGVSTASVRKRRARSAELPEHRLGASALPFRSQLLEARERRLDLAPCPIVAPQGAQRGGEVEPHASGLEPSIARREQIECILERAPRSVVVAAGHRQRPFRGAHRCEQRARPRLRRDLAELPQRLGGALVLSQLRERPDRYLEPRAALDPARVREPPEIAISQLCRLRRLAAVERECSAPEQGEGVRLTAGE